MLREKLRQWRGFLHRNDNAISFFDVKALYDLAYEEKAKGRVHLKKFNALLKQAAKLEAIYRYQIEMQKKARCAA